MSKFSTITLPVSSCSDVNYINKHSELYSYAYRRMYHMVEESSNTDIINDFKEKYNLTDIGYRSLLTDVKGSITSRSEINEQRLKDIEILKSDIEDIKQKISELEEVKNKKYYLLKKDKHKLLIKLDTTINRLNDEVVFGGRDLLKDITKTSNKYNKDKTQETKDRLDKLKSEFNDKRTNMGIYLMGEANQKGNRFINFDFENKTITYKPYKGKKITFKFKYRNKNLLAKLQTLIDNKIIPITVIVKSNEIKLVFDNEILSGYSFNKKEVNRLIKEFKDKNKELTKEDISVEAKRLHREEHLRLEELKLVDKIEDRCIAVDLNPEYIGYSVLQLNKDNTITILEKKAFSIKPLTRKLGKSSSSEEQLYQNNKREHELKENIIKLFKIAKHYKCYKFCMEDLVFRNDNTKFAKEFNRKVRNIWNLGLIKRIINKYITLGGMKLVEVDAYYTSFIGNVLYEFFDPVNASIEIGRRGLTKYIKDTFYPIITEEVLDTAVAYLGIDASMRNGLSSWVKLYQASEESGWRRGVDSNLISTTSRNNTRRKVIEYSY